MRTEESGSLLWSAQLRRTAKKMATMSNSPQCFCELISVNLTWLRNLVKTEVNATNNTACIHEI